MFKPDRRGTVEMRETNSWQRLIEKGNGRVQVGALAVSYGTLSCCMFCQEYHRSLWWAWWLWLPTDARRWAISKNWGPSHGGYSWNLIRGWESLDDLE